MTISVSGKDHLIFVNQRLALDAKSAFRTVGTIDLRKGQTITLLFSNKGTDGFVVIDAIQILKKP